MSNDPAQIAIKASEVIKWCQESMPQLSLLELESVFKVAATTCAESNSMYERAQMAAKLRGWRPGS